MSFYFHSLNSNEIYFLCIIKIYNTPPQQNYTKKKD